MRYLVVNVGQDWIEMWDRVSIVDPDIPRHRWTDQVYVGDDHGFLLGDVVELQVKLVERKPIEKADGELEAEHEQDRA